MYSCDITKVHGKWLSTLDKQHYHQQVKSKGEVEYSTGKVASKETIHPSKRQKLTAESASTSKLTYYDHVSSASEYADCEYEEEDKSTCPPTRKYSKIKIAINLVTSTGLSTNKAGKISKQLSHDGIGISTPIQAAI